jgi:predicted amidohydrolase
VLFPECATTGYACDFTKLTRAQTTLALSKVAGSARDAGINVLVGSAAHLKRGLANCLVAFDRYGREAGVYAKCQLTDGDKKSFKPGNAIALFKLDGILTTAIICHERRYPELARLGVMAGAQIIFHPNAGMDDLTVSKKKRGGRDGMAVRAFENAVYYVFANSVGPQGGGKWSAGDSKIVAPSGQVLKLANNRDEALIIADLDLSLATRKYARESLMQPKFLARHWKAMLRDAQKQLRQ